MKQLPLLSILVPVYGVEEYIEKCARSLFSQSYANIEYIFVNDCTKDNSIEILKNVIKEYPNKKDTIKIIEHDKNRGHCIARETALKNSSGEYIWYVDSDDWISKEAVQVLMQKAIIEELDIVGFNVIDVLSTKNVLRKHSPICCVRELAKGQLLRKEPFVMWSYLMKKELFDNVFFDSKLSFGEDWSLMAPAFSNAKSINYIEDICYNYNRQNINSITYTVSDRSIDSAIRAYSVLESFFTQKGDDFYIESLNGAKQNLYIHLLKMVVRNNIQYSKIWNLLRKIDFSDTRYIQSFNKPIVFFANHSLKNCAKIFIKLLDGVKRLMLK